MYSQNIDYEREQELKDIISNVIKNKNQLTKQHSDCLNCLINCAQYRFTLQVIRDPKKGKNNLFFIIEDDNIPSPLFFYKIPSNEIVEIIENKNLSENLLNNSQKIKTENDIINDYDQNKKNQILLFNYLIFPLININYDSNINKESTIIILDDGKYDTISNCSIKSYSSINKNYSLLFDFHNLKNAKYLFSLNDIKDAKEIIFKFNGNIHGKQLFKNDAFCCLSPELIINSIKKRMEKYINLSDNEIRNNLYNKYFFAKLIDDNRNNMGIFFSFNKKKDINGIKLDKDFIIKHNYLINKIFMCIDMWINSNNYHETKDTSKSSSKISNSKKEYYEENNNNINYNINCNINYNNYNTNYYNKTSYQNYNYNNNNTNKYNNYNYVYNNDFYNNIEYNSNYNEYNSNNMEYNNNYNYYYNRNNNDYNNTNNNYNNTNNNYNINNKYDDKTNNSYKTYYKTFNKSSYLNNENKNKFSNNNSSFSTNPNKYDSFWKKSKTIIDNKFTSSETIPSIQNTFDNKNNNTPLSLQKSNHFENMEFLENCTFEEYYELNILLNNIKDNKPYIINSKKEDENKNINENKDENKTNRIFIDTNQKFIKEIFLKYKQNDSISNFSILKKRIDINMNISNEKLKKIKLKYFFECFKDINYLSLNIPYINKKGKLLINELNPTLSSMRLVLKVRKNIAKKIKKQKKEQFVIKIIKENLIKIEYEEVKPPNERDLLYNKIDEIKQILGDNKLTFKNVLFDKSYFCILWSFTNSNIINSSFLAYYSFDFKLIGILIIKLDCKQWLSSFSDDNDYKNEYNKNIEELKAFFKNLPIDKDDGYYQNFYTHDYIQYIQKSSI